MIINGVVSPLSATMPGHEDPDMMNEMAAQTQPSVQNPTYY